MLFDIGLSPTGDAYSAFHTQNDPSNPYQRKNWAERKGDIDVRCSCLDVAHGTFLQDDGEFCTLLVLELRFDSRKQSRRIEMADMKLRFSSCRDNDPDPEVYAIAPEGRLLLQQTSQSEEVVKGGGLHFGAGGAMSGPDASGEMKWEKKTDRDTNDATTVVGSIDTRGRTWGNPNCASWTLLENATTKTGVPAAMRVAIKLKRKTKEKFQCTFTIDAKVDWKSSIHSMFASTPADDPVLFDPMIDSTNNLHQYKALELGAIDLAPLSDITFNTVFAGAMKEVQTL